VIVPPELSKVFLFVPQFIILTYPIGIIKNVAFIAAWEGDENRGIKVFRIIFQKTFSKLQESVLFIGWIRAYPSVHTLS